VGKDVNTFFGYSLFSLKAKYGDWESLGEGDTDEDKFWILHDLISNEEEIIGNEQYLAKYYDQYLGILNRGGMTLVSPRYAHLFHGILFAIALKVNESKVIEHKDKCMEVARGEIREQMPGWKQRLVGLTKHLPLSQPKEACAEFLEEVLWKAFHAKGNSIVKRYYSKYLARGGKKSSQSSQREERKQEGLGKKGSKGSKKDSERKAAKKEVKK
jgi:hypothetical protein